MAPSDIWSVDTGWDTFAVQRPLFTSLLAIGLYLVAYYINSPLRKYPGPFFAKFTNLWRMYRVTRGDFHNDLVDLHKKYGPIVRVGPNLLDVEYPEMIKTVFNIKGNWKKTEFYFASSILMNGKIVYNIFSEVDNAVHAAQKKPIAKYYSPVGVAQFEPHMDKVIAQLCDELETRFMTAETAGKPFDLGRWVTYYTWDVVGAVTFSKPLGYLAQGRDFDGTLRIAEQAIDYFAWVGCIPWLDHVFDKNRIYRLGPPGFGSITGDAINYLVSRYQGTDGAYHSPSQPDYLDKFIEAKAANPDTVDDNQIVSWLMINMLAGADTTSIILRSALYYSLKNPRVWNKLRHELASAGLTTERARKAPFSYKEARAVPYLEAVVREALRYLPGVALSLERYVPPGGHTLPDGSFVPQGVALAFNPYVLCRNDEAYGQDAHLFRPERWLRNLDGGESEEAFAARLRLMNDADLSFGAGSRICIGQHMGLMQVSKVVATLAAKYDIALEHPDREWKVINSWFPRQEGLDVRMTKRVG